jgi:adenylate kinase family enzyme
MRYVVVGTSGAGKTTFATALARAVGCPYTELDALYWGPQWTPRPHEIFERGVRAATEGEGWVVDGNYSAIREVLWARASHIVWLNHSRPLVYARVLNRTMRRLVLQTPLWHGNQESYRATFLSRDSILLWAFTTFSRNQQKFGALRSDPKYRQLQWIEITTPRQAREFLASHVRATESRASAAGLPGT